MTTAPSPGAGATCYREAARRAGQPRGSAVVGDGGRTLARSAEGHRCVSCWWSGSGGRAILLSSARETLGLSLVPANEFILSYVIFWNKKTFWCPVLGKKCRKLGGSIGDFPSHLLVTGSVLDVYLTWTQVQRFCFFPLSVLSLIQSICSVFLGPGHKISF